MEDGEWSIFSLDHLPAHPRALVALVIGPLRSLDLILFLHYFLLSLVVVLGQVACFAEAARVVLLVAMGAVGDLFELGGFLLYCRGSVVGLGCHALVVGVVGQGRFGEALFSEGVANEVA